MNIGRYSLLLLALTLLFAVSPIFQELSGAHFLASGLIVFTLISALYAVRESKFFFRASLLLCTTGVLLEVFSLTSYFRYGALMKYGVEVVFFILVTWVLLKRLLLAKEASSDTICGAISVYLLLGLTWGFLYQGIELLAPGSFSNTVDNASVALLEDQKSQLFYFSYIMMTTVGYGDIVPLHPIAKSFAMLQAIVGQMYLAVLVARLVALQIIARN